MNAPLQSVSVAVNQDAACIKVVGRANFVSSMDVKTLFSELEKRGVRRFLVELKECVLMDSTFSGVLAKIAMRLGENPNGREIVLINPSSRIQDTLDNLGVLQLCRIVQCDQMMEGEFKEFAVCGRTDNKIDLSKNSLEAHETLMAIKAENIAKFKDVTRFLAEDIRRSESGSQ